MLDILPLNHNFPSHLPYSKPPYLHVLPSLKTLLPHFLSISYLMLFTQGFQMYLFLRNVLIFRGKFLEKIFVLISKNVLIFSSMYLFVLIFSRQVQPKVIGMQYDKELRKNYCGHGSKLPALLKAKNLFGTQIRPGTNLFGTKI